MIVKIAGFFVFVMLVFSIKVFFMRKFFRIIASTLLLGACTPVVTWHGNTPPEGAIEALEVGVDTPSTVIQKLGPPTAVAPLGQPQWYYMSYEMKKYNIRDTKPDDEQIIVVNFDQETGLLASVSSKEDIERTYVPIDKVVTPSRGTDTSILQELLGNIGKFKPPASVN